MGAYMLLPTGQEVFNILESHEAYDFLIDHCEFIGEGSFNKVFVHPHFKNRVIKYNGECCDGTFTFAEYCNSNIENRNLPLVFEHSNALWHEYIVQEKLSPLTVNHHSFIIAVGEVINSISTNDFDTFKTDVLKLIGTNYEESELAFLQTVHNVVVQFASHFVIDISIDNVMLRNNTLVLVDPLAQMI